jgi:hypothetical protein
MAEDDFGKKVITWDMEMSIKNQKLLKSTAESLFLT